MSEYGKTKYHEGGIVRQRNDKFQAEVNHADKRRRKSFDSMEEARDWIKKQQVAIKKYGRTALSLKSSELEDAKQALQLLKAKASLKEAAMFWLRHNEAEGGTRNIEDYYSEYLKWLETTAKALRSTLPIPFHEREAWLRHLKRKTLMRLQPTTSKGF